MFGYKTVRAKDLNALEAKVTALEGEVKGYYENAQANNAYFKAITPLLKGMTLDDTLGELNRLELKKCYETNGPAYGIVNKIAKASRTTVTPPSALGGPGRRTTSSTVTPLYTPPS